MLPPPEAAREHPALWAMRCGGVESLRPAAADRLGLPRGAEVPRWRLAPHLELLDSLCLDLFHGRRRRIVVSMPPRHGKSELLSRSLPGWWLGRRPDSQVILASYGDSLTTGWSARARDDLAEYGPEVFGVGAVTRASRHEWKPVVDGRMATGNLLATGVGGVATGKGADLLVADDLIKGPEDADSASMRDRAWEFFEQALMTRLAPEGVAILIGTRWHPDDPIGRLMRRQLEHDRARDRGETADDAERWDQIDLPAIATAAGDALGRAPGESLWPQQWPLVLLERKRASMSPRAWSALYQQQPIEADGQFFKSEWLRYYAPHELPALDSLVRYACLDLAASQRTWADYTALVTVGAHVQTGRMYVLDVHRARLKPPDLLPLLERTHQRYDLTGIFVEQLAGGLPAVVLGGRLPMRAIKPKGDKVHRAGPLAAAAEAGRLLLPRGAAWLPELEEELLSFPNGKHDDQVDALAYAAQVMGPHRSESLPSAGHAARGPARDQGAVRRWRIGR